MKLLHLIHSIRRETGGPAEGLRILAEGYNKAGHEVAIATLDGPEVDCSDIQAEVHKLGRRSTGFGYSPHFREWLRDHVDEYSAVIVDGLWQYHNVAALRALPGRCRYAVMPHGMLDPWFKHAHPLKHLKKLPFWLALEYPLLRQADAVLFTSPQEAELAKLSFPGSSWTSRIVSYGSRGPIGDALAEKAAFFQVVPEVRKEPFLLFAGRLHPKKGCDLLLKAYSSLWPHMPLPKLVFAGPDPIGWLSELKHLAKKLGIGRQIIWAGMLTGAERWGAFRAAEALILPSHQENFGMVVAESLSCGTPVLLSTQVNTHQIVTRAGCGISAADGFQGTRDLLSSWMTIRDATRAAMSERALQCWQQHFDSSRMAKSIVEVFSGDRKSIGPENSAAASAISPLNRAACHSWMS